MFEDSKKMSPSYNSIKCPKHKNAKIIWSEREYKLLNNNTLIIPYPICEIGEHGLWPNWLKQLKDTLSTLPLPPETDIIVHRKSSKKTIYPKYITELESQIKRHLILPNSTKILLKRARWLIKNSQRIYNNEKLLKIAEPKLNFIFYGPPGTGKTSAFLDLTDNLIQKKLEVSLRSLVGSHLGDTEKNVKELTDFVKSVSNQPTKYALLIDDADDFLSARSQDDSAASQTLNGLKIAIFRLLDSSKYVPIIITTNRITSLDPAIHRRIMYHIEFPIPDYEMRYKFLDYIFNSIKKEITLNINEEDIKIFSKEAEKLSYAEIALALVEGIAELMYNQELSTKETLSNSIKSRHKLTERTRKVDWSFSKPT